MNNGKSKLNSIDLFEDINTKLLFGFQCSAGNSSQQTYLERLRFQTESAFINKKFET